MVGSTATREQVCVERRACPTKRPHLEVRLAVGDSPEVSRKPTIFHTRQTEFKLRPESQTSMEVCPRSL